MKILTLIATSNEKLADVLERVIGKLDAEIVVAKELDGVKAYSTITEKRPFLIIADDELAAMDGINLCKRVKIHSKFEQIYCLAVVKNEELKTRFNEICDAQINDVITKPLTEEKIVIAVRNALQNVRLRIQMNNTATAMRRISLAMEETKKSLDNLPVAFIKARISHFNEKSKVMIDAAKWIAEKFGDFDEKQLENIVNAARVCDCGRIFLPDKLAKMPIIKDGAPTDDLMYQIPAQAKNILKNVPLWADCADILYAVYENFDGTGFPEKIQSWQIPISSRIIRVVSDYADLVIARKMKPNEAVEDIKRQSKKLYDNRVVTLLEQFVMRIDPAHADESALQLHELEPGMVVKRDVITNSGLKLLPAGATLSEASIKTLIKYNTTDPIIGDIVV